MLIRDRRTEAAARALYVLAIEGEPAMYGDDPWQGVARWEEMKDEFRDPWREKARAALSAADETTRPDWIIESWRDEAEGLALERARAAQERDEAREALERARERLRDGASGAPSALAVIEAALEKRDPSWQDPSLDVANVNAVAEELRSQRDAALEKLAIQRAEADRLRARTHEIQERESRERAALQSQVDRFRHAFARAEEAVRDFRADWTTDPPSQEPYGFWRYTSQVTKDAMALVVQQRLDAEMNLEQAEADWQDAMAELEATKRAKAENDERFQIERDEARRQAIRLRTGLEAIHRTAQAALTHGAMAWGSLMSIESVARAALKDKK